MSRNQVVSLLLACTAVFFATGASAEQVQGRKIMAIFAHPDDESTVSPLLAYYARLGVTTQIVMATDGRYGSNDFHDYAAGEELAAVRRAEMKCAADTLGAELVHLPYHDQLRAAEGYDGHIPHVRALLADIRELIETHKPDVIVTWGPDGGSNHMDHRLVGATVTNVFLSRQWPNDMTLFYVATPADTIGDADARARRGVDRAHLDTAVRYEERDLVLARNALRCHKSQFSADMVDSWFNSRIGSDRTIHFRRYTAAATRHDNLLE